MDVAKNYIRSTSRLLVIIACVVLTTGIASASAQGRGGGGRPQGPGGGSSPGRPPKSSPESGRESGRIIKFKPANESGGEEGVMGVLIVKPFSKDSKILKMEVRNSDSLEIKVTNHTFESEDDYANLFWKGLQCTASWALKDPTARRHVKELKSLTFDTIDVEGKIISMEDGMVFLKAIPKGDRQWPDLEARDRDRPRAGNVNNQTKRIPRRKLKLKILDNITQFLDAEEQDAELGDFDVDQKVEATVVYGRPYSMLITLRVPPSGLPPDGDDRPGSPPGGRPGGGRGGGGRGG